MDHKILLTLLIASALPAADAWADPCADAKLSGAGLTMCQRDLKVCDIRYNTDADRERCKRAAVASRRKSQEGREHRRGVANAERERMAACQSAEYLRTTKPLKLDLRNTCGRANGQILLDRDGSDVEWKDRLSKLATIEARVRKHVEAYPQCTSNSTSQGWTVKSDDIDSCERARDRYRHGAAEVVNHYRRRLEQAVAISAVRPGAQVTSLDSGAVGIEREAIRRLVRIAPLLEPWGLKTAAVTKLADRAEMEHQKIVEDKQRIVNKLKCPAMREGPGARKLKSKLLANWKANRKPESQMVERVGQLATRGQPRITTNRLTGESYRDQPAHTCSIQKHPERPTACRYFRVTFRQVKPPGGRWGPYEYHSIGGGNLVNCKTVRAR